MKAEEFYKEWHWFPGVTMNDKHDKQANIFDYHDLIDFATQFGEEDTLEFTEFLLQDYEMDCFDNDDLCWVLAGTQQKYSTKKIYEIWKALKTNKE